MKALWLALALTLASVCVQAQRPLDKTLVDRIRAGNSAGITHIFDSLFAFAYFNLNPDSALQYANGTIQLAEASGNGLAVVEAYQGLGQLYLEQEKYGTALDVFNHAYELADREGGFSKGRISLAMAQFFTDRNLLPEAAAKATESVAIGKTLQHAGVLFKAYYLRALIHYRSGEYAECIKTSKLATAIFPSIKVPNRTEKNEGISAYNTIGLCFKKLNRIDSALHYLAKAESTARAMNVEIWVGIVRGHRAEYLLEQGKLGAAFTEAREEYVVTRQYKQWNEACHSSLTLARIQIAMKNFPLAKQYLDSAHTLLEDVHGRDPSAEYWKTVHQFYAVQQRHREALKALEKFDAIRDSTMAESEKANLKRLVAQYQLRQKEKEIELLVSSNRLRDEQLTRKDMERKVLLGSLVLFSLLLIVIFAAFRNKQRTNRLLEERNKTIEEHREELAVSLENLTATQEQLVQSEKMASLGQLTAGIAHELNNPLNFIAGAVESLQRTNDELTVLSPGGLVEAQRESTTFINIILIGVRRMSKIVQSLVTFSGVQQSTFVAVDIRDPLNGALTMLSEEIASAQIDIVKLYAENLPSIHGNESQLTKAFHNILENAVHALLPVQKPKQIRITTSCHDETVTISIHDNGTGIDADILHRITDPFFTTKEVGKGQGLGLTISRAIINLHSGKISVKSNEENGTELIVHLPV